MRLLLLDFRDWRIKPPPLAKIRVPGFAFSNVPVSRGYFPGGPVVLSFLTHAAAIFLLLISPAIIKIISPPVPMEEYQAINLNGAGSPTVIYLPKLGGGRQGNGRASRGARGVKKGAGSRAAQSAKGYSYPGNQPVVSNPPLPTNRIQTVLHPAVRNPPALRLPASLPNIVQSAQTPPRPSEELNAEDVVIPPTIQLSGEPLPEHAKLYLPESKPPSPPVMAEAPPPKRTAKVIRPPKPPPKPEPPPEDSSIGLNPQTALALSPLPAPPNPAVVVPEGEARGRFALSPDENPAFEQLRSGLDVESALKNQSEDSTNVNLGAQPDATAGDAAVTATGNGSASGIPANGGNGSDGTGTGTQNNQGNGGTGAQAGIGSGEGSGAGAGAGVGSGSGTGAGAGPGMGVFPGITIQGGTLEGGSGSTGSDPDSGVSAQSKPLTGAPVPPQTSYPMTIVSLGNSGGGLADFGVFTHEQVYTVYLDMRRTTDDPAPTWTLLYSMLPGAAAPAGPASGPGRSQEGLVPPIAIAKELPVLPVDLVRKNLHKMVIVAGILNLQGKLEKMSVRQSPDAQLNEPLLETLNKWSFWPAELNGKHVPVKVLLGIPLSLSP